MGIWGFGRDAGPKANDGSPPIQFGKPPSLPGFGRPYLPGFGRDAGPKPNNPNRLIHFGKPPSLPGIGKNAGPKGQNPFDPSRSSTIQQHGIPDQPMRTGVSFQSFQKKQKHPVILAAPKNHRIASRRTGSFPRPSPGDFLGNYDFSDLSTERHNAFSKKGMSSCLPSAIVSRGTSSVNHVSEREMVVKAKQLARFSEELRNPEANHNHASPDKKIKDSADQCLKSSQLIVGLCPDMCPESERRERERKGDLDMYECLNGKRNQTSKFIAVKKYTRTAEQDAALIRPMPVLQMTVDYLLELLDRPYDDKFLGIYNFLWDRMRAVRMDLRMQHIFNPEATAMLENMIRLHVIAMHELCEQKKGEGFSKGFDACLNIEQMNKTSIELFQMYDDNRKKGSTSETEKEFRGYYALLKLDKHPSYKVEPADFSRDLSRMTSEIRSTSEILFARDVSRACRIGNYVSFFKLAKKATYLQACLMHAHFAKVRRQALASLHKGLRHNQGIPISDVTKWLAMEDEDVHSLLEYHGFVLKRFDEIHMVKEGPFLNIDSDFTIKCSQLVHSKKSRSIVDDVCSSPTISEDKERKLIEEDYTHDSELERVIFTKHSPACREGVPVCVAKETPCFSEIVEKEIELDVASKRTDSPNIEADINLNDKEILHCKTETLLEDGAASEKLVEGQVPVCVAKEAPCFSEIAEKEIELVVASKRTVPPNIEAGINLNDKEILHCKIETLLEVGTAPEKFVEGQSAENLNRESVDDSEGSTIESNSLFLDTSIRTYAPQVVGDPILTDQTLPESKESKISFGVPECSCPNPVIPNSCPVEAVD